MLIKRHNNTGKCLGTLSCKDGDNSIRIKSVYVKHDDRRVMVWPEVKKDEDDLDEEGK